MVKRLARYMRSAGCYSGAYVVDLSGDGRGRSSAGAEQRPRILASNTKLFTTTAALDRFGTEGTLGTEVLGTGELDTEGVFRGRIYLRGGGDPTFGSRALHDPLLRRRTRPSRSSPNCSTRPASSASPAALRGRVRLRLASWRPRLGLRRVALGGSAQRAVLQPRPVHRERARLPGEPAGLRGRAPGRRARGARHRRCG